MLTPTRSSTSKSERFRCGTVQKCSVRYPTSTLYSACFQAGYSEIDERRRGFLERRNSNITRSFVTRQARWSHSVDGIGSERTRGAWSTKKRNTYSDASTDLSS